jgi:hypothetical protein
MSLLNDEKPDKLIHEIDDDSAAHSPFSESLVIANVEKDVNTS